MRREITIKEAIDHMMDGGVAVFVDLSENEYRISLHDKWFFTSEGDIFTDFTGDWYIEEELRND